MSFTEPVKPIMITASNTSFLPYVHSHPNSSNRTLTLFMKNLCLAKILLGFSCSQRWSWNPVLANSMSFLGRIYRKAVVLLIWNVSLCQYMPGTSILLPSCLKNGPNMLRRRTHLTTVMARLHLQEERKILERAWVLLPDFGLLPHSCSANLVNFPLYIFRCDPTIMIIQ